MTERTRRESIRAEARQEAMKKLAGRPSLGEQVGPERLAEARRIEEETGCDIRRIESPKFTP